MRKPGWAYRWEGPGRALNWATRVLGEGLRVAREGLNHERSESVFEGHRLIGYVRDQGEGIE